MTQRRKATSICLLVFAGFLSPVFARSKSADPKDQASTAPRKPSNGAQSQEEGERVFLQNCSRCHAAPEGFPQHISGTVVRHMRVRASLSEHDEQALLKFFNP